MIVDGKSTDSDEALLEPISSDASGKAITDSGTSSARRSSRRYDVDWLRSLALSLLIIYHISIIFQPWAAIIGFSQNEDSLEWLWGLMSMINVWRIPLLFTISGMGVYFAISRRTWRDLLSERTFRIMLPLVFGFFLITPINVLAVQLFFEVEPSYFPNLGHLWFLLNIYIYVILFLPLFFYLKHNPNNIVSNFLREALRRQPLSMYLLAFPLIIAVILINPESYPAFAESLHGYVFGGVCFLYGFLFVSMKGIFWKAVERTRFVSLAIAFSLYLVRLLIFSTGENGIDGFPPLAAFETLIWLLAVFGLGSYYLNRPSRALNYLNQAVYPVYILHMPFLLMLALFILPISMPAVIKLIVLIVATYTLCLLTYEIIKRIKWIRPLFGMRFSASGTSAIPGTGTGIVGKAAGAS